MSLFRRLVSALDHGESKRYRSASHVAPQLALVFALVLAAIVPLYGTSPVHAKPLSYSCGTGSLDHCYGEAVTDFNDPQYEGATTRIYMVQLGCPPCDGFIDNEMWLNSWSGDYWVEVGYWLQNNPPYQSYFWADYRPVDAQNNVGVNVHVLGTVPSSDYGLSPTFTIRRASSSSFNVHISSPNDSWNAYSTNNGMDVGNVTMGQELAGTNGAYAPSARYSYRYYWDSAGIYTAIYNAYNFKHSWPPYTAQVSGDPGYDFYTWCC